MYSRCVNWAAALTISSRTCSGGSAFATGSPTERLGKVARLSQREYGHAIVRNPEIDDITDPLDGQIKTPDTRAGLEGLFDLDARSAADSDDSVFTSWISVHTHQYPLRTAVPPFVCAPPLA